MRSDNIPLDMLTEQKRLGQYFTPPEVAALLVKWATRGPQDRLLDPSCGDGEFLVRHANSTGVDLSEEACVVAGSRAPSADLVHSDFFEWAETTNKRFDAAAGNPPFIRYQLFNGDRRTRALKLCAKAGANISGLTSSWAPFIVASSTLLRPGGSLAFVVPAEIGHASYSFAVLQYLCSHFSHVHIIAIREKIFPELSTDVWLLHTHGFGQKTSSVGFSAHDRFAKVPDNASPQRLIDIRNLRESGGRLRRYLLPPDGLAHYDELSARDGVFALGSLARVGIGYVSGDNSFFHLRPSEATDLGIPKELLRVTIRKGSQLSTSEVTDSEVARWIADDQEVLLLDLNHLEQLPTPVTAYLDSEESRRAMRRYKCRTRKPWFAVPDVSPPDAFLTYMNGVEPSFVLNSAACVCTNSILAVRFLPMTRVDSNCLSRAWGHPLARLSQEIEGHPLGGGMLKLEPREASRVKLPLHSNLKLDLDLLQHSTSVMRSWRHISPSA